MSRTGRNTPSKRGGPQSSTSSTTGNNSASGLGNNSSSPAVDSLTDGRRRQNKKDEAIRRKLETEISKRQKQVGKTRPLKKRAPGSVLALKPSPPLTMRYNTSIHEAAQFMSAKREDCVLVLDEDDGVCGIFTAKDLAFKIVGSGVNAKSRTIADIMTKDPLCAQTDTSATEALNLMVTRGFRHLPVMDENHDIAGVLDITKCFYEAMQRLERAYESSRKLHDALEGVQSELGMSQPSQIINYVEALRARTEGPDLESVLDGSLPVFIDARMPVSDAASLMKDHHTTAVLVTDQNNISGIFTSKDVVLRVLAAGLDPRTCSVVRVMTPQPDFAPKSMSIQAALRKMHDGHYLNLPVMGDENEVVGIVDVLKLTYATLEQVNSMNTGDSEGPAWNKFWMALDNDSESAHSSHHRAATPSSQRQVSGKFESASSTSSPPPLPSHPGPEVSSSELAQFSIGEIGPNDSVSRTGGVIVDDVVDDSPFPFKFKSPGGRVFRITLSLDSGISFLRQSVIDKLQPSEIEALGGPGLIEDDKLVEQGFAISYVDDEGDAVAITSSQDLMDAILISKRCGLAKGDLFIHHYNSQIDVGAKQASVIQDEDEDEATNISSVSKNRAPSGNGEVVPGVPNELLLPGAIVVLAVSIVLAFTFGRTHR